MSDRARTIGHYEILDLLATGGMGEIYRARDLRLSRDVALKILPVTLEEKEDALRRFTWEARAASALNHPNVVMVHEVGMDDRHVFIATEYVDGQSLRTTINTEAPLPLRKVISIGLQVAAGLAALHRNHFVHRDLKPDNILIDQSGLIKIADFGLATLARHSADSDASLTQRGVVIGTPAYMAPEQIRAEDIDQRADLFSFGVILYELTTGQKPFDAPDLAGMFAKIMSDAPPPSPNLLDRAGAEFSRILFRLLEKRRELRYQSTSELLEDLHALDISLQRLSTDRANGQMRPEDLRLANALATLDSDLTSTLNELRDYRDTVDSYGRWARDFLRSSPEEIPR